MSVASKSRLEETNGVTEKVNKIIHFQNEKNWHYPQIDI